MPSFKAIALEDLMRASADDEKEDMAPPTPPDVLAYTLKQVAANYAAPCPFKAGDLVTPRRGYNTKGVGLPHVVLEVLASPKVVWENDNVGSPHHGAVWTIRVACEVGGNIMAYWMHHYTVEPYTGPVATVD